MQLQALSADAVIRALSIRDLTDPTQGSHAMQLLLDQIIERLRAHWGCRVVVHRQSPIVSIADNYDRLHYPEGGAARDARYTRYVCDTALLRTQTSAMIPPLLRGQVLEEAEDVLLVCPGLVYRRDCIDKLHTGEPHQLDLWRIRRGDPLTSEALDEMVTLALNAALPGRQARWIDAIHPYTVGGRQVDVEEQGVWVEVGECGLASPRLLAESGHPAQVSGLAMGLGLDRLLMLRKGIDDIRLLRSLDPRIRSQMDDLEPYQPVSTMPPVRRDLSIVVAAERTAEELGDLVRETLGQEAEVVEHVEVLQETALASLPPAAVTRLGISEGQKNVLLRITLRAVDRTLTHPECNTLRDRIYRALHEGTVWHWASAQSKEGSS